MVKLQNIAKQLGNEVKHLGDGLQEKHEREPAACSVTESTQDLFRNSEKKLLKRTNELQALDKEISKCFLTRTEAFNEGGFLKEEDLLKLRKSA